MAGVKGRSGGARPGAGRKRKASGVESAVGVGVNEIGPAQAQRPVLPRSGSSADAASDLGGEILSPIMDGKDREPLDFLLSVQNDPLMDPKLRVRAAIAAAQYKHAKTHDGGKKDAAKERAEKAAGGRFAARAAPALKLVGGA